MGIKAFLSMILVGWLLNDFGRERASGQRVIPPTATR